MPASERLLYPLDEFYARAGLVVPGVERIEPREVPSPYRELLVHHRDMTPTLEEYHREELTLRVIGRRLDGATLSRLVVLEGIGTRRAAEFGAITIHLDRFPEDVRDEIRECRRPLGAILERSHVRHVSRPWAFFRLHTDPLIKGALDLQGYDDLYGRRNRLLDPSGASLADVIEILPPLPRTD